MRIAHLAALVVSLLLAACANQSRQGMAAPQGEGLCAWPMGEGNGCNWTCDNRGAYRWTVRGRQDYQVRKDLGLDTATVTMEVDVTVLNGEAAKPGGAGFGIGCLSRRGGITNPGRTHNGYLGLVKTNGAWAIMKYVHITLTGEDKFIQLTGTNEPGTIGPIQATNRIGITCSSEQGIGPTVVSLSLNGQGVKTVTDSDENFNRFFGATLWVSSLPGDLVFERFNVR